MTKRLLLLVLIIACVSLFVASQGCGGGAGGGGALASTTSLAPGETTTSTTGGGTTTSTAGGGTTTSTSGAGTTTSTAGGGTTTSTSSTTSTTQGGSGTLDTTLNSVGYLTKSNIAGGNGDDVANGLKIDASGNIVVAGSSKKTASYTALIAQRFNSLGQLDTSFNTTGTVVSSISNGSLFANALAIDSNGKIVLVGHKVVGATTSAIAQRLKSTGVTDETFASGSNVELANGVGGSTAVANSVGIDSNGKVVGAGYETTAGGKYYSLIFRLTSAGSADSSFAGGDGVYDMGDGTYNYLTAATTVDGSNRIIGVGYTNYYGDDDWLVYRLAASNGALDSSFGSSGLSADHNAAGGNSHDRGLAITLDGSGKILSAGYSTGTGGSLNMAIWRYATNGEADTSFGGGDGSTAYASSTNCVGNAIALDGSGRILVAGYVTDPSNGDKEMAVWRYGSTGTIDTTFGTSGVFTHSNATGAGDDDDVASAIAVDSNGKIVVAGYSTNSSGNKDLAIWRLNP